MQKEIISRNRVKDAHLPQELDPIIKQIYAARGVKSSDELDNRAATLHSFKLLKGVSQASEVLFQALQQQSKILIVGDFDADGATSTATLMCGLPMFGFSQVDYLVPNRFDFGYGLSPALAQEVVKIAPDLLITVDNGISCIAGVDIVKAAGIKVIVTDHHLPGNKLPKADAIVNPNQIDCEFPSTALAGVGVAFYLLLAFRSLLRDKNWFENNNQIPPNIASLLDLVALGTVADVVPLDANNRTLVHQGLARIKNGVTRPGIEALIEVSNRNQGRLSASDFGFSLAPRLNAAGRLDDMSLGIACLLSPDLNNARRLAGELDALNIERREIEQSMQVEAQVVLDKLNKTEEKIPDAVCLFQDDWHQGVIGILAGRLKEKYHRPTVIFACGDDSNEQEQEIKGSCRSIPGLHIRDLLESISTANPGLILKFGGHAMAAGLSIKQSDFIVFERAFTQAISEKLTDDLRQSIVLTDGELPSGYFTLEFAQYLKQAGPWGQEFPEPVFEHIFEIVQQRIVGEKHLKLVLKHQSGFLIDGIAFNIDVKQWPNSNVQNLQCAFTLDINEFRGKFSLQLLIRELLAK
ncbi:single-stranded-DNA-specific exonuclease RecJ [Pseudoalteromonas denitrificans]|uniref:Single-stranded-DNA-specific exonuclease RecJ n=1 Tax=Pseudoalteromonas denitrificans DSM 6059 TaxID=1123010 RepID=A0A1I1IVK4_9GAMM|nr:single-stranded-DNA-specific exonuclease RecJ [Pseudoalteromonas denitrificans]SFC37773.1 single-stranded-DNA-specific exonuclease [Pseudoalteromonas denitrificans DSM 6059]